MFYTPNDSIQQSSATPSLHLVFGGLRKIVAYCELYLAVPSCVTCFWHSVIPTSYFIFNDVKEGATRLVPAMCRLEICHNKKWGSVCNDFAGTPTAFVTCRQLGYTSKGLLSFTIQLSTTNFTYIITCNNIICNARSPHSKFGDYVAYLEGILKMITMQGNGGL